MRDNPCSADDCNRPAVTRSLCGTHYARERFERVKKSGATCVAEDCSRAPRSAGFCSKHRHEYYRQRNAEKGLYCIVDGCSRPVDIAEMCNTHYRRMLKGFPDAKPIRGTYAYIVDRNITIECAHDRVVALWGRASAHVCINCGRQALDWAYDDTDPSYLVTSSGRSYSRWPEFYMPMCRRCHKRRDGALAAMELRSARLLTHKTGLSIDQIEEVLDAIFDSWEGEG